MAALLQEIINIYPAINPPVLTAHQSNRVCNALALLQCVASHPDTRSSFLLAHIPLYLYPFLHTVSKTRPFEYLRLTSLGVIGALVKTGWLENLILASTPSALDASKEIFKLLENQVNSRKLTTKVSNGHLWF